MLVLCIKNITKTILLTFNFFIMKKKFTFIIALLVASMGFAQTETVVLDEGFTNITTLTDWAMTNQSSPLGSTGWFQGGSGTTFPGHEGGQTSYIGANFNNTSGGTGVISNWLITPVKNLKDGDKMKFWTRVPAASSWNDRLEVRTSTGTMTLPSGSSGVGSFTKVEMIVNDAMNLTYPEVWTEYTITLSGIGTTPTPVNFAFRYNVTGAGPSGTDSNFIGIDTVKIISISNDPPPVNTCTAGTGTGSIPDNAPSTPLEISFNITGASGSTNNVELSMTATHTWVGDLRVELFAPNGTSHVIFSRTGQVGTGVGDSSNLGGEYKFSDAATGTGWWEAAAIGGTNDIIPPGAYRTTAAGPQTTAGTSPATNMNAAFAGVSNPNGTWVLKISDFASGDTGAVSAACLKINGALAVSDVNTLKKTTVYPNPVNDVLNISTDKSVKSVNIYNATGQKVVSDATLNNGQMNVSRLTSGVYMLNVQYENGNTEMVKILKK